MSELSKQELINLVKGVSPRTIKQSQKYVKLGLMTSSGHEWSKKWHWVDSGLETLTPQELFNLYLTNKI